MPRVWLIVSQLLFAVSLPVWFVFFGFSLLVFEGGFEWSPVLIFVALIWLYPVISLVGVIASWVCYRRGKVGPALLLTSLPLLYLAPLALAIFLSP